MAQSIVYRIVVFVCAFGLGYGATKVWNQFFPNVQPGSKVIQVQPPAPSLPVAPAPR